MTIITKLATARSLTITIQVHNSYLKIEHLANSNDSSNLSDNFARCGRTISPLTEKNYFNREQEQPEFSQTSIQGEQLPSGNACKLYVTVE